MKPIKAAIYSTLAFLIVTTLAASYSYQTKPADLVIYPIVSHVIPSNLYNNPEVAKGLGYKGVVKVEFPNDLPKLITVSRLHSWNITFTVSLISFYENSASTELVLGAKGEDVGYMDGMLGTYTSFEPNGTLTLVQGESVEARMILSVPNGVERGMSFPRGMLGGFGFGLDGFLLATNLQDEPQYQWQP